MGALIQAAFPESPLHTTPPQVPGRHKACNAKLCSILEEEGDGLGNMYMSTCRHLFVSWWQGCLTPPEASHPLHQLQGATQAHSHRCRMDNRRLPIAANTAQHQQGRAAYRARLQRPSQPPRNPAYARFHNDAIEVVPRAWRLKKKGSPLCQPQDGWQLKTLCKRRTTFAWQGPCSSFGQVIQLWFGRNCVHILQ